MRNKVKEDFIFSSLPLCRDRFSSQRLQEDCNTSAVHYLLKSVLKAELRVWQNLRFLYA